MAEVNHFYDETTTGGSYQFAAWSNAFTDIIIAGASLTANTKYLIIAKAVFGGTDAGTVFGFRVRTDDDTTVASYSEAQIEPTYTTTGEGVSYFFVRSYTTDSSPSSIMFEMQSDNTNNVWVDQGSLLLIDLDDLADWATGYEDTIPTDPGNVWGSEANASDGSETTYALNTGSNIDYANGLQFSGSTLSGTYSNLEVRVLAENTSLNARNYAVGTSDSAYSQITIPNQTKVWSPWVPLSAVTGSKNPDQTFRLFKQTGWTAGESLYIYKVEIRGTDNYVEAITAGTDQGEISDTTWGTTDVAILGSQQTALVEYLVLGYARHQPGSTGVNYHVRLIGHSGTAQQQLTYHSAEGEDTVEYRVVGVMGRSVGSTLNAIAIQSYEDAANGNWNGWGAYLIAIDVSAFADFDYLFRGGGRAVTGTPASPTLLATISSYTPTTSGNHLVLGRFNYTEANNEARTSGELRFGQSADQSQSTGTGSFPVYGGSGNAEAFAQAVTAGFTQTIYTVSLRLQKVGSPTDNLTLYVKTGSETGAVVDTSEPVAASSISTAEDVVFQFDGGVSVTPSTVYYLVLERSGSRDLSNYVSWLYTQTNPYAGGIGTVRDNGSWRDIDVGQYDFRFDFPPEGETFLSGDIDTYQTQAWDPTDAETVALMARESLSSSNIELRGAAHASDSDPISQYEFVAVLNLNLAAAAAVPFVAPRRQLTTVRM